MDAKILQDVGPIERKKLLRDSALKTEMFTYPRALDVDSVTRLKDEYTQNAISMAKHDERKKEFIEDWKADVKPMRLVSELMGFEAKINKEVEAKADERANRRVLLAQTVTTNLPESFKMKIPIFKGQPEQIIEVEIGIDPVDLSCLLVSPEANDIITEVKNSIIDEQLAEISKLHPSLRIFEV